MATRRVAQETSDELESIPPKPSPFHLQDVHVYKFGNQSLALSSRYKPHKVIGSGAYGIVVSATDLSTGESVAIKKISNAFDDVADAKRILREMKLLRHFQHPNIIALHDILTPPSIANFRDVYLVSELMDTDLHQLISSGQHLTPDHTRYFIYQLLSALRHIHASGVIHRDIKPQNILLNADCDIKLCDFGLARGNNEDNMTEYVVTRWYRAPEILLACGNYGPAVDLWSVGCIFGELLLRVPLFPGDNFIQTTKMICQFLGKEQTSNLDFVPDKNARRFITDSVNYDDSLNTFSRKVFTEDILDDQGFHLLESLLQFSPYDRIEAEDILDHPYFSLLREEVEPEPEDDGLFCFTEEEQHLNRPQLQELVFREIAHFDDAARAIVTEAAGNNRLFFPLDPEEYL